MIQILQQSERDVEMTVIYRLKALMEKVANSYKYMGNFSRKMEIPRKRQMEMLEIKKKSSSSTTKTMISEMKNSFTGLINRLDTVKQRIGELNNGPIGIIQIVIREKKE